MNLGEKRPYQAASQENDAHAKTRRREDAKSEYGYMPDRTFFDPALPFAFFAASREPDPVLNGEC